MSTETVTITCVRHRFLCVLADPLKGEPRLRHVNPGSFGTALCDSQQFTVRREYQANRGTAHAELLRLDMLAKAQAALDSSPEENDAGR